jgi:DNA-binding NarL/FixJ family response regulator
MAGADAMSPSTSPQEQQAEPAERLRVLVADDDALVADGLALQLEGLGHEVVGVAKDGREALAAALALDPDVLLLDIRMPGVDGLQVCRDLMAERPLPIIMVTGYGDHQLIARAEASGAVGYLLKPSEERRLDAAITQALARFSAWRAPRGEDEQDTSAEHRRQRTPAGLRDAGQSARPGRQESAPVVNGKKGEIAAAVGERPQGRIKVLILEHHYLVAEALATVLGTDPGLDVVGAQTDPQLGLADVRRTRPNVLLMDYGLMPSGGAELTAAVRDEFPELKVVVLTPALDEDILFSCVRAGAVACVTKDHPPRELVRSIERVHAGEMLFPPSALVNILTRAQREQQRLEAATVTEPPAPRELEVLQAFATGASTREVAERLGITVHTVRTHLKNAMTKLHAHSRLEAVTSALRQGLIELGE